MILKVANSVNAGVRTVQIKDVKHFWVRMRDIEKGLGLKGMRNLVREAIIGILGVNKLCDKDFREYKRSLQELTGNIHDNMKDKYVRNDIAEKIIKNCRGVKKTRDNLNRSDKEQQRQNFRLLLGFTEHDTFLSKEQSVLNKLLEVFLREEMYQQYSVLSYKIDLYFVKYKLAVEIDEHGHKERDSQKELSRENTIKQKLGCKFIRINPELKDFSITVEINRILEHIKEVTDKEISELKKIIKYLKI